jgi:hypothetical protein
MRIRKKALFNRLTKNEVQVSYIQQQLNSTIEILLASGIIEALNEGEDMVTIKRNVLGMHVDTKYKINEVF